MNRNTSVLGLITLSGILLTQAAWADPQEQRFRLIPNVIQGGDIDIQTVGQTLAPVDPRTGEQPDLRFLVDEHQIFINDSPRGYNGLNVVDYVQVDRPQFLFDFPDEVEREFRVDLMILPGGKRQNASVFVRDANVQNKIVSVNDTIVEESTSWHGTSYRITLKAGENTISVHQYNEQEEVNSWEMAFNIQPYQVYRVIVKFGLSPKIAFRVQEKTVSLSGKPLFETIIGDSFTNLGVPPPPDQSPIKFPSLFSVGTQKSKAKFWNASLTAIPRIVSPPPPIRVSE